MIPETRPIEGTFDSPSREVLRILFLEDSAIDAEIIQRELQRHGLVFTARRVETKSALCEALEEFNPHVVLSDLTMPAFSGIEGLKVTRQMRPTVPFIYVSGTIGEDRAVELLRQGATDYVLKQNPARLMSAVERALKEAESARERRRAEEQLRKLSRAVEHSPAAIVITDADGVIEYVNPKFEEITGYSAGETIGQNPRILKSGETPPETYADLWRTIRAGEEWRGELRNRRKNGELFWEAASISGIRDDAGAITHFVAVKEDVTERKRMEGELLRAQRMESIGTLASGVAHDLNNILAPILMAAPLLRGNPAPALREKIIATVEAAAQRGTGIVQQVLAFGRGVEGQRLLIEPTHLIREIAGIAGETFPKTITVTPRFEQDMWGINGDPTQIHQILLNLAINARDAMPEGGTLVVSCENIALDESYASMVPDARAGRFVLLKVSDTGTGIPRGIIDRIFDPFFTTKEVGKGTGLGLSTVLGIVKSHGGFLRIESAPGKGTTFQVFLPAAQGGDAALGPPEEIPAPRGNGELVLVVDDEAAIRTMTEAMLRESGYEVLAAADGTEAIAIYSQHCRAIKVVLTDVVMPYLDGVALTRALKRIDPEVKIIATSGQTEDSRVEAIQGLGITAFLLKPFHSRHLLAALHDALPASST